VHLGLASLYGAFLRQGFDDVDFIASAGLTDADLDAIGVKLPGHRYEARCHVCVCCSLGKVKRPAVGYVAAGKS
jgi:hypothetical protein